MVDGYADYEPEKFIHVIGTQWARPDTRRVARLVGTMLAENGYGLVAGDSTGVDRWVSEAFCRELSARHIPVEGAFRQIALGWKRFFLRGGSPNRGYPAQPACRFGVDGLEAFKSEVLARSHGAVMIGGGRSALSTARRFMEHGHPVFPLPMLGGLTGNTDGVFHEILKTWETFPVPGVSRSQFLQLAEPWIVGTGPLARLLRAALTEEKVLDYDVFVSYRRADTHWAVFRLVRDLQEHFGERRVFRDVVNIGAGENWKSQIHHGIDNCQVGLVVIGANWLAPGHGGQSSRLFEENDMVRDEIAALLASGKKVVPVLVDGAGMPKAEQLPEPIRRLTEWQAVALDELSWDRSVLALIRDIERVVRESVEKRLDGERREPPPRTCVEGR